MSVQYAVVASQKFNCPGVTGEDPAVTVAVRVTTAPWDTEVTSLPPLVTVIVTVVAEPAKAMVLAIKIHTREKIDARLAGIPN